MITMASTFDNYPVRLLNGNPWPKNSPNKYTGWTTLSTGVAMLYQYPCGRCQVVEKLTIPASYAFATEKLGLNLVADDMNTAGAGPGRSDQRPFHRGNGIGLCDLCRRRHLP